MGIGSTTAIGRQIKCMGIKGNIIGIVKNFNFKSIQQPIGPLVIRLKREGGSVAIRIKPQNAAASINVLEKISKKLNPAYPFSYSFLDKDLANLYQQEQRMGKIFNLFALLAIFISCLGLYGLSAFTAEQRTKEIGVRKVLGASIIQVTYMLLVNFTKLISIAMLIAIPLSWLIMNKWLNNFAYHITISWSIYLFVFCAIVLIACITVSYESVKAAIANPIKSLRTE